MGDTPGEAMHHLRKLIDRRQAKLQKNLAQIAAAAREAGHAMTRYTMARHHREPLKSVNGNIICALAAGLQTTHRAVADAVMRDMGVPLEPINKCVCFRKPGDGVVVIPRGDATTTDMQEMVAKAHAFVHNLIKERYTQSSDATDPANPVE